MIENNILHDHKLNVYTVTCLFNINNNNKYAFTFYMALRTDIKKIKLLINEIDKYFIFAPISYNNNRLPVSLSSANNTKFMAILTLETYEYLKHIKNLHHKYYTLIENDVTIDFELYRNTKLKEICLEDILDELNNNSIKHDIMNNNNNNYSIVTNNINVGIYNINHMFLEYNTLLDKYYIKYIKNFYIMSADDMERKETELIDTNVLNEDKYKKLIDLFEQYFLNYYDIQHLRNITSKIYLLFKDKVEKNIKEIS